MEKLATRCARYKAERDCARQDLARLRREVESMRDRLMPEGMEWPRFEDGEPVRIGDAIAQPLGAITVRSVEFTGEGGCELKDAPDGDWYTSRHLSAGNVIHRPAPEVVDADGVEIRVGDEVWPKYPSGRDDEQVVRAIVLTLLGDGRVEVESEYPTGAKFHEYVQSDQLTHERPDSWERLEEDATIRPSAYCHDRGLPCDGDPDPDAATYVEAMARDIVRRAKKLAERGK